MIKKIVYSLLFTLGICVSYIAAPHADDDVESASPSIVQLRIACTLAQEAGGSGAYGGRVALSHIASAIQRRYIEYKRTGKNPNLTYSDILYAPYAFENSMQYSTMSPDQLYKAGKKKAGTDWESCLSLARQVLNNTLQDTAQGANSFATRATYNSNINKKYKNTFLFDEAKNFPKNTHVFFSMFLGYKLKHRYEDDETPVMDLNEANTTSNGYQAPQSSSTSSNESGEEDAAACRLDKMKSIYLQDGKAEQYCWYCNIVILLTNSFLTIAADAYEKFAVPLGKIILKLGFLIWLGYFILQQLTSLSPIKLGQMLQDIASIGVKVAVAWVVITNGVPVIIKFIVNPIVGLGVDYGWLLFNNFTASVG